jgi:hypothetical protein
VLTRFPVVWPLEIRKLASTFSAEPVSPDESESEMLPSSFDNVDVVELDVDESVASVVEVLVLLSACRSFCT